MAATAVIVYLLVLLRINFRSSRFSTSRLPTLRNAELDALLDGVFSDYEADLDAVSRFGPTSFVAAECFPRVARNGL